MGSQTGLDFSAGVKMDLVFMWVVEVDLVLFRDIEILCFGAYHESRNDHATLVSKVIVSSDLSLVCVAIFSILRITTGLRCTARRP